MSGKREKWLVEPSGVEPDEQQMGILARVPALGPTNQIQQRGMAHATGGCSTYTALQSGTRTKDT